jgi:uncharacterized protein YrrD
MRAQRRKRMRFIKGSDVLTSDEEKIDSVDRVIIDPADKEVSHLVVGEGMFFGSGRVIPIEMVESTPEDEVRLGKKAEELESLPVFEEAHFVPLSETEQPFQDVDALYWYPPVGGWWNTGNILGYAMPRYVLKAERNIPEDMVALEEGANVLTPDGEQVGHIKKVETENDRVTHLVISAGLLFTEEKTIPSKWTQEVRENEVLLSVDSDTLENTPVKES